MRTPELTDTTVIDALWEELDGIGQQTVEDALAAFRAEVKASGLSDEADALWMRAQFLYRRRREAGHGPR